MTANTHPAGWIPLPTDRLGLTDKRVICGFEIYTTLNFLPNTAQVVEIFCKIGKEQSTLRGFMDIINLLMSLLLRTGAEWCWLREHLQGTRFAPNDEQYTSIIDGLVTTIDEMIEVQKQRLEIKS